MFSLTNQKVETVFHIYLVAAALTNPKGFTIARSFFIRARSRAEALGHFQLRASKEEHSVLSWEVKDVGPEDVRSLLVENQRDDTPAIVSGMFKYSDHKKPTFLSVE